MRKVRSSSWMRLISAVLVALFGMGTLGVGTSSGQSDGNTVLYPLIVKDDPRVVTLVTYMGPNFVSDPDARVNGLHYQYHSKLVTAASTDACTAGSVLGDTSPNDVLTLDTSGFFGVQPLFNDNTSLGVLGLNLVTAGPAFAYMTINSQHPDKSPNGGPGFGEAQIVDLANGGIWGYNAVAIPGEAADGQGIGGGVALLSGTRRPVHLYPPTVATTNFSVTPTGTSMIASSTNRARVQLQLSDGDNRGGVYDRNENPIDFTNFARTRCVWVFPLSALVGIQALNNPIWSQNGGWAWFANRPTTAPEDPNNPVLNVNYSNNALVFKIMSAGSAGSFVIDGQPVFTSLCGSGGGPETGVLNGGHTTSEVGCALPQ